jgi:methyl-accepting chemotaxis protein
MLLRMKIGARLAFAFGSIVLLLAASSAVGLYGLHVQQLTAHNTLSVDAAMSRNASEVRRLTLEARRYEKDTFLNVGFLPAAQAARKQWENAHQQLMETLDAGEQMAPNEELRGLYQKARDAVKAYSSGFDTVYARVDGTDITDPSIALMVFGRFNDKIQHLDGLASAIDKGAAELMGNADSRIEQVYQTSRGGLLLFAALTLLIGGLMAVLITRSIVTPLQNALTATRRVAEGDLTVDIRGNQADETGQLLDAMSETNRRLSDLVLALHESGDSVLAGAHEVLLGSEELSKRTDEQVSALQQTASSMEQITTLVRQNSDTTEQACRLAEAATRAAQSSGEDVAQSIRLMQELAASSQRIDDIIKVIDTIAFQTNILALNASVEAARAGEQGRGFAVVANEVRTLASRSAASASEIRTLIEEITGKISHGARQADHSGHTIRETIASIGRVSNLMEEIAAATREQSSGIDHINGAINQLDSTTQRNAALVEQSRAAAANLEGQAEQLTHLVSTFKVNGPYAGAQSPEQEALAPPAHFAPSDSEAAWAPA